MTATTGSIPEIAHSCSICDQIVVNLNDRIQSHILGQLGKLKQQAGAEQCELLQQYASVTKAGPETNVELRLGRYRDRKDDMRALISREGWNEDDEEQSQQVQLFHVYSAESRLNGILQYSSVILTLALQMTLPAKHFLSTLPAWT